LGKATAQGTIERPADEVWAIIGDFADQSWNPTLASMTCQGDIRTAVMHGVAGEFDEKLFHRDEAQRTYTYGVVAVRGTSIDMSYLIGGHRSTITVTPTGPASCRVSFDLEMPDGQEESLRRTSGGYQQRIDELKARLEGAAAVGPA